MSVSSDQWPQFYDGAAASAALPHGGSTNAISNSKPTRRRSRASRKAPTTLLNASTANFRDLVQQFTGFQAAGAAVPLGAHKGPVNLSFGHPGDEALHSLNHPSVMVPFSDARHFHYRHPPLDHQFASPPDRSGDGLSRPAPDFVGIQNLMDEDDLDYDLQELAMEFSSSNGNGNGNYSGGYFP